MAGSSSTPSPQINTSSITRPRSDQMLPAILAQMISPGSSGVLISEVQQSRSLSEAIEPAAREATSSSPPQPSSVPIGRAICRCILRTHASIARKPAVWTCEEHVERRADDAQDDQRQRDPADPAQARGGRLGEDFLP